MNTKQFQSVTFFPLKSQNLLFSFNNISVNVLKYCKCWLVKKYKY